MKKAFLNELIDSQRINSEAIQGSRPWKVYGEGLSFQPHGQPVEKRLLRHSNFLRHNLRVCIAIH